MYNTTTKHIMQRKQIDFVVIGSGIAGLNSALSLAKYGKVLIVTKSHINASSTFFAQGGIAAVTKKADSIASHINDTLTAGYHHNKKQAVNFLVKNGQKAVDRLIDYGVMFDKQQDGDFVTSYEAAHSYPRILHATDFTGQEIQKALVEKVLTNPHITIWEQSPVIDLITKNNICYGASVLRHPREATTSIGSPKQDSIASLRSLQNDKIVNIFSRAVVLATGGTGQLYQWTTNPEVATGDGIALAKRAGVQLSDLEFIQFHPTALKSNSSQLFLLSEALRGEGGYLVNQQGERFMQAIHPLAELAPRDVVARAIFSEQKTGDVYIDMRHKSHEFLTKRFPKITNALKLRGFDLSKDLIPVTPAAHFMCGGIVTDLYGRTSMQNLFAYGEVAATGVHGANRLASNSLLEGIVFSGQIEKCIDELPLHSSQIPVIYRFSFSKINPQPIAKQIRQIMWDFVGITRSAQSLTQAENELSKLQKRLSKTTGINKYVLEIQNMLTSAIEITKAAKNRHHSLGTHSFINV